MNSDHDHGHVAGVVEEGTMSIHQPTPPRFPMYAGIESSLPDILVLPAGRHPSLPSFLNYEHHELWPYGPALVYEADPKSLFENRTFFNDLRAPPVTDDVSVQEAGYVLLQSRMAVFCRNSTGSCLPKDDIIKLWVYSRDDLEELPGIPATIAELLRVQSDIIGDAEMVDGMSKGGVAFERDAMHYQATGQGPRCYALSTTIEASRHIHHPASNARCKPATVQQHDTSLDLIRRFNYYTGALFSAALYNGSPAQVELQNIRGWVSNTPCIGHPWNVGYYDANQLNIAGAVPFDSAILDMSHDLGNAGEFHCDLRDDPSSYTAMMSFSSLPLLPQFHPGYFFLPEQGLAITLNNFSVICFSGLHRHGGSPPRPLTECSDDVLRRAVRLTAIAYPVRAVKEGQIATCLGPSGSKHSVELNKTMCAIVPDAPPLNFASHSYAIMDPSSSQQYLSRAMLQLLQGICHQLPEDRRIYVDPVKFLSHALFTLDSDGQRHPLPDWPHAIGGPQDTSLLIDAYQRRIAAITRESTMLIPSQLKDNMFVIDRTDTVNETSLDVQSRIAPGNKCDDRSRSAQAKKRPSVPSDSAPQPKRRSKPMFIHDLQHIRINELLIQQLTNLSQSELTDALAQKYGAELVALCDTMDSSFFSQASLEQVASVRQSWRDIHSSQDSANAMQIIVHLNNARRLFSYFLLYSWITTSFSDQVSLFVRHVNRTSEEEDVEIQVQLDVVPYWLRDLVTQINAAYGRNIAGTRHSIPIGSIFDPDGTSVDYSFTTKQSNLIGEELRLAVLNDCKGAVATWLGMKENRDKPTSLWELRGKFLKALVQETKTAAVFFLDEVSEGFQIISPYVFTSAPKADFTVFHSDVQRALLQNANLQVHFPIIEAFLIHASHEFQTFAPMFNLMLPARAELDGSLQTGQIPIITPLEYAAKKVTNFVSTLRPLLEQKGILREQNDLCKWVIKAGEDGFSPFREHAPSRQALTQALSELPDRVEFIRSQAGLFTIVVFRAITFNSVFLQDVGRRKLIFHDSSEWDKLRDDLREQDLGDNYLCRKAAYGACISGRSADLAAKYWTQCSEWEAWFKTHSHPSFKEVSHYVQKTFSQIGPLISMLIAMDLVYETVVEMPSITDFAIQVYKVDKGAFKGLNKLQAIPDTTDEAQCCAAFKDIYDLVRRSLTPSQKHLIPDMFHYEHALCKISKALSQHSSAPRHLI